MNEINDLKKDIGNLIIHQLEFDLQRKQMLETKAAAYVAIVVFILTIETQYFNVIFEFVKDKECIFKILFSSCCCKNLFFSLGFVFCSFAYCWGFVLLLMCAYVLYVRNVAVLKQDALEKNYKIADSRNVRIFYSIVDDCIYGGKRLEEVNLKLGKVINNASLVIIILILHFIMSSLCVFFVKIY